MQRGLVADVPHAEEHGGSEGDDHGDHGAFQVHCIANLAAALGGSVGHEEETLESLESALQPSKTAAFHKVRLDFADETPQTVLVLFHAAKIQNIIEPSFFRQKTSFFLTTLLFFIYLQSSWFANS